jgi:hypothetical protein
MIPTKIKDDITNVFFCNYISSCMTVLEAAFSVDIFTPRKSKNYKES